MLGLDWRQSPFSSALRQGLSSGLAFLHVVSVNMAVPLDFCRLRPVWGYRLSAVCKYPEMYLPAKRGSAGISLDSQGHIFDKKTSNYDGLGTVLDRLGSRCGGEGVRRFDI